MANFHLYERCNKYTIKMIPISLDTINSFFTLIYCHIIDNNVLINNNQTIDYETVCKIYSLICILLIVLSHRGHDVEQ